MLVQFTAHVVIAGVGYNPGQRARIDAELAQELIAKQQAIAVESPKRGRK